LACSAAEGGRTAAPRLVIVRVVEDGKEDVERNAALAASGEMLIDGAIVCRCRGEIENRLAMNV